MKKLAIVFLIIMLLLCLTACNGETTEGVVTNKFMGEACLFRTGQLKMVKSVQTGYVVIGTSECAVSKEQYNAIAVGDWVELQGSNHVQS